LEWWYNNDDSDDWGDDDAWDDSDDWDDDDNDDDNDDDDDDEDTLIDYIMYVPNSIWVKWRCLVMYTIRVLTK